MGAPRSFASADRLAVTPGQNLDLVVELLTVAAPIRAGRWIWLALAGHAAACFDRYGPADETLPRHAR
jgi:hypothetical protein